MAKKKSRRGGWPKRERVNVMVRVSPEMNDWLVASANLSGRSKGQFVERWLESLREALEVANQIEPGKQAPWDAVNAVGWELMKRAMELGMVDDYLKLGLKG